MSQHLKTRILRRLTSSIATTVPFSPKTPVRSQGVRYLTFVEGIDAYFGAMNTVKEGQKYRKHIIVRRCPRYKGLFHLYTYHFPKTWSAACVANRELIKRAQQRAHVLEHDHSYIGIEWRVRFFRHYFRVFRQGQEPEPGFKRYSRFYQYTYVAIYRELKREQTISNNVNQYQTISNNVKPSQTTSNNIFPTADDVTFMPIFPSPTPLRRVISMSITAGYDPPLSLYLQKDQASLLDLEREAVRH